MSAWLSMSEAAVEAGYISDGGAVLLLDDMEGRLAPPGMVFNVSLVKTDFVAGASPVLHANLAPYLDNARKFAFTHVSADDFRAWLARRAEKMLSSAACAHCGGTGRAPDDMTASTGTLGRCRACR